MDITSIGLTGYKTARTGLQDAAHRLVNDVTDVDAVVDLKSAEQQAKLALKLIQKGDEIGDALLDILA